MQALEHARYLALREGAHVLEADGTGDKVLRLVDGSMLKLFRRKRLISSAAWYPYAQRFADNCQYLAEREIPCPRVIAVYRITAIARDAVHYDPLPGQTLRQVLEQPGEHSALRAQLGRFIATLHERGVYFRSAHMGNVVLTPEGQLGLIDIADLRIYQRPLRKSQRLRNFRHMLRYRQDRHWLLETGDSSFVDAYLASQQLCTPQELANALG
ncbi:MULTISPECIES: phosphotransferase [Pseudomonas]|uniref:tRNA A-37 threonylcarbamoyl transferase component Bud32 n=1 Tax=Pseudomonas hunanensis TaxID=1247546 RepID=A0ACC6K706_9PSED|nr:MULTISPECIES: phosphotransferase [Pseudomonas]MBP2260141.1 tRNA A-37 threonylcarbamoyl transferase component Bud32 [Pseudomonas sp. BP8]MDR6714206.1 tRNA A-37 threonylcarbamoyl transferase component Bud32 [Pseudomonas hunanensis]HDS1737607.1 phosphotransferase [Pseudomonas putida]